MNEDGNALLAPPGALETIDDGDAPPPGFPQLAGTDIGELARLAPRRRGLAGTSAIFDWSAFVLAFILPPIGLLLASAAVIIGVRGRGWTSAPVRAATAIGLAFCVVLAAGGVIGGQLLQQRSAHDAIVASSRQYCELLRSDPTVLRSASFGWPAAQETIPASITSIEKYERFWSRLDKVAPAGIRSDTSAVDGVVTSILKSVKSTRVLNDADNQNQMQQIAADSGIQGWVSSYCG